MRGLIELQSFRSDNQNTWNRIMKKEIPGTTNDLPSAKVVYPVNRLMRGNAEVILVHEGEEYRLRVTRNILHCKNKLILTK